MPKVEKNQENLERCRCAACPSYKVFYNKLCEESKEELLFCSEEVGKSHCAFEMLGCLCGDCPVHEEHDLKTGYYCIKGSADYADDLNKMN